MVPRDIFLRLFRRISESSSGRATASRVVRRGSASGAVDRWFESRSRHTKGVKDK